MKSSRFSHFLKTRTQTHGWAFFGFGPQPLRSFIIGLAAGSDRQTAERPVMNRHRKPARAEWDFSGVLVPECKTAAIWKFARESRTLRRAKSLDHFPQTDAIIWLSSLRDDPIYKFLDGSWLEARAKFLAYVRWALEDSTATLDSIKVDDPDDKPTVMFLGNGQVSPPGWKLVAINPARSRSNILRALDIAREPHTAEKKVLRWVA